VGCGNLFLITGRGAIWAEKRWSRPRMSNSNYLAGRKSNKNCSKIPQWATFNKNLKVKNDFLMLNKIFSTQNYTFYASLSKKLKQ